MPVLHPSFWQRAVPPACLSPSMTVFLRSKRSKMPLYTARFLLKSLAISGSKGFTRSSTNTVSLCRFYSHIISYPQTGGVQVI
jgi:hypothetical protein